MNTRILSNLSLISDALPKTYRSQLKEVLNKTSGKLTDTSKELCLNIYAAFVYSQGVDNFNAIEIINDTGKLQEHLDNLIGFIYSSNENKTQAKSKQSLILHKALVELTKAHNIKPLKHITLQTKINEYTQSCIDKYQLLPAHQDRLEYLNGWTVTSPSSKTVLVNLDAIYVKYGCDFTSKIHEILKHYALTQKTSTLGRRLPLVVNLLESVVMLDKDGSVESLESLLDARNVQSTFYKVYQLQLAQCIIKQNDIHAFNKQFVYSLATYEAAFICTKAYPAPLKPFICPNVNNIKNPPSFSSGGKTSEREKSLWFADIPLHIKDEAAIKIIEERLSRVMSFMREAFESHFEELKKIHIRNKKFCSEGAVKPLTGNGMYPHPIGYEHLANTISTFYRYGVNGCSDADYSTFLGYKSNAGVLLKELNLPTNFTLRTLTALLVMEHPKITPSWLQKLQLFDANEKKCGYFQSGEQFILSSEKERRGRNLAHQDVILNDYSKSLVDFIIEHTQLAREHLKSIGNPNWKYLLLTCSLNQTMKASNKSQLYKAHTSLRDFFESANKTLTTGKLSNKEVEIISSIPIHRAVRRHRGLQIYLETRSQSAVADALGHKVVQPQLLESYLPKPLMEFFTERVVRQFQKAIILKAMEKSPHLLDAVNMSYEEIEEFLKNHGIDEIPNLNAKAFDKPHSDSEQSLFDSVIFTMTVPLIQLLISIRAVIEGSSKRGVLNFKDELVEHWYNCAAYLLIRFEQGNFNGIDEIGDMYKEAKSNPLNPNLIKGAISC